MLALAHWPHVQGLEDQEAEQEIGWLVDLVTEIRSSRAETNVPGGAQVPLVLVNPSAQTDARVKRWSDMIKRLARISDISIADQSPKQAIGLIIRGEVVALPTETVYGLAANALDQKAVAKIYEIKGRPAHNPIIVHVAGNEMAQVCVSQWPALAEKFSQAFWPGPLTLVLARAKNIPDNVSAVGTTLGVRWPRHPFLQAVIREGGFPLAAVRWG